MHNTTIYMLLHNYYYKIYVGYDKCGYNYVYKQNICNYARKPLIYLKIHVFNMNYWINEQNFISTSIWKETQVFITIWYSYPDYYNVVYIYTWKSVNICIKISLGKKRDIY